MGQSDEFTSYMIQDAAQLYSLSLNSHLHFCKKKKPCFLHTEICFFSVIGSNFLKKLNCHHLMVKQQLH